MPMGQFSWVYPTKYLAWETVDNCNGTTYPLKLYRYIPSEIVAIESALLQFSIESFRAFSKTTSGAAATTGHIHETVFDIYEQENILTGYYLNPLSNPEFYVFWNVYWDAQTFEVPTNSTATGVSLWIRRWGNTGTENSDITIQIQETTGGLPNGSQLGGNATIQRSAVSISYSWVSANFATAASLTANTRYAIVVDARGLSDPDPGYGWGTTNVNAYTNGGATSSSNSGANWGAIANYDNWFKITGTASVSIKINGTDRTTALGGPWTTNQNNIDIVQYLNIGEWNTIELIPNQLMRLNSSVLVTAVT